MRFSPITAKATKADKYRNKLEKQALKQERKADRQQARADRIAAGIKGPILAEPMADGAFSHG
jgi:hypothetical protein